MSKRMAVQVEGVRLTLSNLDKELYPEAGFTKRDVIQYYFEIAPVMLPHLRGRALTMKRFPKGVKSRYFYEKQCPFYHPDWVSTVSVASKGKRGRVDYCNVDSVAALVWVANLASLEFHTLLSRRRDGGRPTMVMFDLDPGSPADIMSAGRVALRLRERLAEVGLASFVKTSGGKGLHVSVPLNTPADFADTKAFARGIAGSLEEELADEVTAKMRKQARVGKVFVDWRQNEGHKTTVCAYSLRAQELPTVSTPVTWEELEEAVAAGDASLLRFGPPEVVSRVRALGDVFAPVLKVRQKLPRPKGERGRPAKAAASPARAPRRGGPGRRASRSGVRGRRKALPEA